MVAIFGDVCVLHSLLPLLIDEAGLIAKLLQCNALTRLRIQPEGDDGKGARAERLLPLPAAQHRELIQEDDRLLS